MEARLTYKKLMLYHNIITSDDKRAVKRIIKAQEKEERKTTWYSSIKNEIKKYKITVDAKTSLKSRWKKHVKEKINENMEKMIRKECNEMKKARTVRNDRYEKKGYLENNNLRETKKILKTRLHMTNLPGNYKGGGTGICTLCEREEGSTEHYFQCPQVNHLARTIGVNKEDLEDKNEEKMKNVANFIEKVEIMLDPSK